MMNKTKCDFLGEFGLFQLQPNPPPLRARANNQKNEKFPVPVRHTLADSVIQCVFNLSSEM